MDKPPPQSIGNEWAVLGACLYDPLSVNETMNILVRDDFYSEPHRKIFDAIHALWKAGKAVDSVTAYTQLKEDGTLDDVGGMAYVTELSQEVPTCANTSEYANVVKEKAIARAGIVACMELGRLLYDETVDPVMAIQQNSRKFIEITAGTTKNDLVHLADVLQPALANIEVQLKGDGVTGLRTGYHDLDMMLAGLHPGDFVVIAADTSVGKTALATGMAQHISRTDPGWTLYFSAEMPDEQLAKRMICSEAGVSAFALDRGIRYNPEHLFEKLTPAAGELHQCRMMIDYKSRTIDQVCSQIRGFALQQPVSAVFVDYIQRYDGSGKTHDTKELEIAAMGQALKDTALDLGIPVIGLSQVNKENTTFRCKAIENEADVVLLIERRRNVSHDEMRYDDARKLWIQACKVHIKKQRNGPLGPVVLDFISSITRFENAGG